MIRVEVLEDFNLERFDELKNIERKSAEVKGRLFKEDTFECTKDLADYLLGDNPLKKAVVRVIEVKEEKKEQAKEEVEKVIEEIGDVLDKKKEVVEVEEPTIPKKKKK